MAALATPQHFRRMAFATFFLVMTVAVTSLLSTTAPARAQDDGQPAAADSGADQPKAETPTPGQQPKLLTHIVRSTGWFFGLLLGGVSVTLVALIVLLAMDLRMPVAIPPAFLDEFTEAVNKRRFREAFDLSRNDGSFLGRVLTAGMSRLQYGIEDARETALHTVDSVRASKEQLITYLATIGTLGPMLGLVGTVYGMILAFMELGQTGKQPNPQRLADGISHALVITLLGIGIAVPAIFAHAIFRNRLIRISMDSANVADDLLTQMYHNSKRSGSSATEPRIASAGPAVKTAEA
jgi:biopolymer transport protein ExbB